MGRADNFAWMKPHDTNAASIFDAPINGLAESIAKDLGDRYGPLICDEDLRAALGYKSMASLRQAAARKTTGVPVFSIRGRRGRFARTRDLAEWLASLGSGIQTFQKDSLDEPVGTRKATETPDSVDPPNQPGEKS